MSTNNALPDDQNETYQEGVTHLQEFTCRFIPIVAGMPLEPRRGRPLREPIRPLAERDKKEREP